MTEKRFKSVRIDDELSYIVIDGIQCYIDTGDDLIVENKLNELHNENEQLKYENNKLIVDKNGIQGEYEWLKDENEQLKQQNENYRLALEQCGVNVKILDGDVE